MELDETLPLFSSLIMSWFVEAFDHLPASYKIEVINPRLTPNTLQESEVVSVWVTLPVVTGSHCVDVPDTSLSMLPLGCCFIIGNQHKCPILFRWRSKELILFQPKP